MPRNRLTAVFLSLFLTGVSVYLISKTSDDLLDVFSQISSKTGSRRHSFSWFHGEIPDEAAEAPPYGAIVAAGRATDDLQWMDPFVDDWATYPYNVDNPFNTDTRLQIPQNKGNEAMVYLSYIISNYADLPWMTIFTHGHTEAWHQEENITQLITSLNRTALAREGYINLRCDWYPTCPAEIRPKDHDATVWGPGVKRKETEAAIAGNWRLIFRGETLPDTIASQCCAQFAVTRRAIQRRPKADYERMREWLLSSLAINDISGRLFEKLWAYIFTGQAVQ